MSFPVGHWSKSEISLSLSVHRRTETQDIFGNETTTERGGDSGSVPPPTTPKEGKGSVHLEEPFVDDRPLGPSWSLSLSSLRGQSWETQ